MSLVARPLWGAIRMYEFGGGRNAILVSMSDRVCGAMVTVWSACRSKPIDSSVARLGSFAVDERNWISQMGGGSVSE